MKKELWNIKAKRRLKDLGFNYGDVAQVLRITPGAVSHKLNGSRPTFVDELQGIARMCKLSLSELCEDDPRFLIEKTDKDIFDLVKNMTEEEKETALRLLAAIKGDST